MSHDVEDDEPETLPCYRHPREQTALRCNACDRPICVDCAIAGAVGIKCPECARTSRAARGAVPTHRLAKGIAAGAVTAAVIGTVVTSFIGFFAIILGYLGGMAAGEIARRASGGYRDPILARTVATLTAVAFLAWPVLGLVVDGDARRLPFQIVAAAAAAYGAFSRAS